ncbi:hypothetical protein DYB25_004688, partial [Aphanomyces astaci]
KLVLYAFFKQATAGNCAGDKPSMLDFVAKAKWYVVVMLPKRSDNVMGRDAWQGLAGMPSVEAKKRYLEVVSSMFPGYAYDAPLPPPRVDVSDTESDLGGDMSLTPLMSQVVVDKYVVAVLPFIPCTSIPSTDMLTSVVARYADSQLATYVRLHARVVTCVLALSGVTIVLSRTEPWKLCLLAVAGLILLPVMLQHSFMVHEQGKSSTDCVVECNVEQLTKAKKDKQVQPVMMDQIVLTNNQSALPTLDPAYTVSFPLPCIPINATDGRKGLMPKSVLQIREEMFAKAMGSLRSLSPRNQPVVHHLDLIKYAEEIDELESHVL